MKPRLLSPVNENNLPIAPAIRYRHRAAAMRDIVAIHAKRATLNEAWHGHVAAILSAAMKSFLRRKARKRMKQTARRHAARRAFSPSSANSIIILGNWHGNMPCPSISAIATGDALWRHQGDGIGLFMTYRRERIDIRHDYVTGPLGD